MRKNKILILGHARHGKDTVARMLADELCWDYLPTSVYILDSLVYGKVQKAKGYDSVAEAYKNRDEDRVLWKLIIDTYTKGEPTKLIKDVLKRSDVYIGLRNSIQLKEAIKENLFDIIIGVFSPKLPLEETNEIDVFDHSDFIIYNNGTYEELSQKVIRAAKFIKNNNTKT